MNFREAIAILKNKGYTLNRVKGSHHIFVKEGREVIVPKHSGDVPPFIIRNVRKAK
jgi:predicted RNA binding protein YcfA (HicA-like mRNA interferase family)